MLSWAIHAYLRKVVERSREPKAERVLVMSDGLPESTQNTHGDKAMRADCVNMIGVP